MEREANDYAVKDLLTEPLGEEDIEEISNILGRGELIVYPTETLYGLGADLFSENALEKLLGAKKRPRDMPISIAVSDLEMMKGLCHVTELAERIYKSFLPGPVTILIRAKGNVPSLLTGGGDTIGIRVPDHPVTLGLIKAMGPITATSANIHDGATPWNCETAAEQLKDSVALYLDGGITKFQAPSTVVDAAGTSAKVIRTGVISEEELHSALNQE